MASGYNDNVTHHVIPQELTSEAKRYAAANLNETDEIRENAVAEIRHWIENEMRIRIDDFLILRFLRVCKFNIEETKTRIRNYYKYRSELPEWFRNKDPFQPELQELLDMGLILPLRKPDSQGRLVIIQRGTLHNPKKHKISDLAKIYVLVMEVAIKYYPAASVYGCVLVSDVVNPTLRLIFQIRPHIMNTVHIIQSYPVIFEIINLINTPALFDVIVKMLKSFMNEKMKSIFYVYSDMSHSFKDIPAEILPVEYGGNNETCQKLTEYWKKLVEENADWLTHDENNKME